MFAERGIEAQLVPPTGYPMTLLPGRGIQRKLTLDNVGAVAGLLVGMVRALALLGRLRRRAGRGGGDVVPPLLPGGRPRVS